MARPALSRVHLGVETMPANNVVPLRPNADARTANDNADLPPIGLTLIFDADDPALAKLLDLSLTPSAKWENGGNVAVSYCFHPDENPNDIAVLREALEPGDDDLHVLTSAVPKAVHGEARGRLYTVAEVMGVLIGDDDPSGLSAEKEVVEITKLNDAEVHGSLSAEVLNTPVQIAIAAKADEKKFTVSGVGTFKQFLDNDITKIRVGKKDGKCFVLGELREGRRTNNAVTKLYMMGLDVDSGASMAETIDKLRNMGLFHIVYTTHSHGTTHLEIKRDRFYKWADDNGHPTDPSAEGVKLFLTEEGKYTPDVIASVEYVQTKHETSGIQIILRTRPIDKFRVVFLLETPYVIADEKMSQKDAIKQWGEMILGMGRLLGIKVDRSARDCSRLFYLPSAADAKTKSASARIVINAGKRLDYKTIKKVSIGQHKGTSSDAFDMAGSAMGGNGKTSPLSPTVGLNLWDWRRERGHGFLISEVFKDHCDDRLREETNPGKFTCECPFDDDHGNAGDPDDKGCFIHDAGADAETFAFRCSHDSCADRGPADMMHKAMVEGWFPDDVLTDERYNIAVDDDEPESVEEGGTPSESATADHPKSGSKTRLRAAIEKAKDAIAAGGAVTSDMLTAIVKAAVAFGDPVIIETTGQELKSAGVVGITAWRKLVEPAQRKVRADKKESARKKARKKTEQAGEAPTIYSGDDFPEQCSALLSGLRRLNNPPFMFLHGGDMKRLPGEAEQHAIAEFLKRMSFTDFKTECNSAVSYVAESKEGDRVASLAEDIPSHLWGMRDKPVPAADRFTRVPVFGPDGTLRTEDGYDAATRTILQTSGLNLDPVPSVPSAADLATAKGWLFDKALADFPFVDDFGGSESGGDGSSSQAHVVVMLLHQIARALFTGPTPFFFIDKPQPGSGAGLLVEVLYQTVVGRPASPQALGKNEDEIRKGITSKLSSGSPILFYDNVRNKIHGEALAILGTADWWEDRILGRTENYVGPNRALTVFTGNNMTMADEMVRRMLPIRLDAKVSDPENRADFVIPDLRNWIVESRAELVWSCLVLVQNWIATGRKRSKIHLASYEDFAAVMGGILEAAGISGFLGNLDAFRMSAKIESNEDSEFMQALVKQKDPSVEFSTDDAHGILFDPAGRLLFPSLNIKEDDRAAQMRILGLRLGNHVGRRFKLLVKGVETEVRFERAGKKDHSTRWRFTVPEAG